MKVIVRGEKGQLFKVEPSSTENGELIYMVEIKVEDEKYIIFENVLPKELRQLK